jgi:hypothetical protein
MCPARWIWTAIKCAARHGSHSRAKLRAQGYGVTRQANSTARACRLIGEAARSAHHRHDQVIIAILARVGGRGLFRGDAAVLRFGVKAMRLTRCCIG